MAAAIIMVGGVAVIAVGTTSLAGRIEHPDCHCRRAVLRGGLFVRARPSASAAHERAEIGPSQTPANGNHGFKTEPAPAASPKNAPYDFAAAAGLSDEDTP